MSNRVKNYLDGLRNININVDHKILHLSKEQYEDIYKLMVMDDKDFRERKPPELDIQTRKCLIKRFDSVSWELGYKMRLIEEIEEDILRDTDALLKLKNKVKLLIPEVVLYQKRLQNE